MVSFGLLGITAFESPTGQTLAMAVLPMALADQCDIKSS